MTNGSSTVGGKPSKHTPYDRRLKANRDKPPHDKPAQQAPPADRGKPTK